MAICAARCIEHGCGHPDGIRSRIPRLMRTLPRLQRRIVILRMYRNLSPAQIAVNVGLSQLQVTRLLRSALRQMQTAMLTG